MIFGGSLNKQGIIYTLNLETMKFGTIGNVSYARYGHSASSVNKQVYLFGGMNFEVHMNRKFRGMNLGKY